jgi:hypothetical protein
MDQERKDFLFKEIEERPLVIQFGDNWYVQPRTIIAVAELFSMAMHSGVQPAVAERAQERNRERRTSVSSSQVRKTFAELVEARARIAQLEGERDGRATTPDQGGPGEDQINRK